MTIRFNKTRLLVSCLALSVLVHIISLYAWRLFGTFDFTLPVTPQHSVMVDLTKLVEPPVPAARPEKPAQNEPDQQDDDAPAEKIPAPVEERTPEPPQPAPEQRQPETPEKKPAAIKPSPDLRPQPTTPVANSSLSTVGDFLSKKNEKLSYQISIFGVPVGNAELEAKNEKGDVWLTLRVTSNAAISSVFPVNDTVETRHISGRFIMTQIKQQEGSFKSDQGFTINTGKKRVVWSDNISGRNLTATLPNNDVLDTLSGIYFLRNRQLQVGKTEILHIYDSELYGDVPVEILRRETILLPNLTQVATLVVRPLQQTAGIFRRTGDILIWLTDDANKVPVKIMTSVSLGTVTVELVSAETTTSEEDKIKSGTENTP